MKRFIEGADRHQVTLLTECLDDDVGEDNPVRIVDAFINELNLVVLGFGGADPATTGRPGYHPAVLLKLYITAISTGSSPVAGWNARRSAMSNSCG